MSVEIRVPALGESIVDATIARWLKKEGESVQKDEALVELETDKVNVEVPAQESGVLQKIMRNEGETVAVGEVLAVLGDGAAQAAASAPAASAPAPAQAAQPQEAVAANGHQRPPTPLARRVAEENNVDLSQVQGSAGRVTREDVYNYMQQGQSAPQQVAQPQAPQAAQQPGTNVYQGSAVPAPAPQAAAPASKPPAPAPAPPTDGREERVRLSRRRQTIATRLVEAQHNAAMLTTFNEIDMSAIMDVRARRKESFKERNGVSLGFMSFFTKAVVGALKAFPRLNAEIQGDTMVLKHYYDIGIAVGAEEGLVVPVVRDADKKSFAQIEREIGELSKKARSNTLSLAELQGGTFTITNGGVFGSLLSTPILNAPQVGILGMHKIQERPVAIKGEVVIRPMMYVALSYDHRIVDGREAVQFLVRVKELAEDPETLLIEG
ncbi:MAG TPA: 2-oxoglutarate dehydrogenase complex dihydrolipoyllysine-residue succinyltransferase [Chloroflexia bacterium]|nr:2-oxoglutarate dehydrogenase complex dihydrolipoyllysine-residue succinyltransferase [Chloroflexia bacterium]